MPLSRPGWPRCAAACEGDASAGVKRGSSCLGAWLALTLVVRQTVAAVCFRDHLKKTCKCVQLPEGPLPSPAPICLPPRFVTVKGGPHLTVDMLGSYKLERTTFGLTEIPSQGQQVGAPLCAVLAFTFTQGFTC